MSLEMIPEGYTPKLNLYETQTAIGRIKRSFEDNLSKSLNLKRVSAPLFVDPRTGLNDNLSGVERPVSFDIKETGTAAEVVHSLAKWKRMALYRYGFHAGEGLYTDMNAIRRDEDMDNIHSIYVDQWDWEKVINEADRTLEYLKKTVCDIVDAACRTQDMLKAYYPALNTSIDKNVSFVTTQELEDEYPSMTPKQREDMWLEEHPTTCILQIGAALRSGKSHDMRAPDYDDWALNCDIMFWNPILGKAFEVSSMGVRVSAESLDRQLTIANCNERRVLPFHRLLLDGKLPFTMGGGIGQSRLCMLLLGKAHIGEVQASVWSDRIVSECAAKGVPLL